MKKKILYLITKSEPFGGAQRYVLELATSLPKEDYEVVVAIGGKGILKNRLEESHIKTIVVPNLIRNISLLKEVFVFFFLVRLLLIEKPDILHLNSSKAGGLGALAGRLTRIKNIVFTGHGWAFNEDRPLAQRIIFGILHWITILLTHHTIAVSHGTRKSIQGFPFVQSKINTIYNGLPPIPFQERGEARMKLSAFSLSFAEFLTAHPDAFIIGVNSELHKNKGIDIALQAIAPILKNRKNIALVIAGGGEIRNDLEKMAKNLDISGLVFFLGPVPDVRQYLKAYDLYLMPSRNENLPYALIEAGFAALPSIASSVGGIPEIIEHEKTGLLVPPNNPKALEQALMVCMQNPEKCTEYGTKLQESSERIFPLTKMIDETTLLYQ